MAVNIEVDGGAFVIIVFIIAFAFCFYVVRTVPQAGMQGNTITVCDLNASEGCRDWIEKENYERFYALAENNEMLVAQNAGNCTIDYNGSAHCAISECTKGRFVMCFGRPV